MMKVICFADVQGSDGKIYIEVVRGLAYSRTDLR